MRSSALAPAALPDDFLYAASASWTTVSGHGSQSQTRSAPAKEYPAGICVYRLGLPGEMAVRQGYE